MSERKHWTVSSREANMDRLQQLILLNGGWGHIIATVGERPFQMYAAKTIGVTTKKVKEYLDVIFQGLVVEQKLGGKHGDNSDSETTV